MAEAGTIDVEVRPVLGELKVARISTWRGSLPNWITAVCAVIFVVHQLIV